MGNNKTLVVNFYAGPSAGKTTISHGVFPLLKKLGVNCEMVPEFARQLIYEEAYKTLGNQIYIFGVQYHWLWRLQQRVKVAIADSPLLLTLAYDSSESAHFKHLVYERYQTFDNLDYLLKRNLDFDETDKGRAHNLEESLAIDQQIESILNEFNIPYKEIYPNDEEKIVQDVLEKLGQLD